jgi:hypothetical protein
MYLRQIIKNRLFNPKRRSFLLGMLSAGIVGPAVIPKFMRLAIAMGALDHKQGMRTVKGDVKINGVTANVGSIVNIGDTVTTGSVGYAIFVIKRSVYLVRENSTITPDQEPDNRKKDKVIYVLTVINHTDEELILLESMVSRRPPFVDRIAREGGGSY